MVNSNSERQKSAKRMKLTEREKTSNWVVKSIQDHLDRKDFISAVLLAYVYSHIRLRTLVTDHLSEETWGRRWQGIHKFLSVLYFSPMLQRAKKLNIVNSEQFN